MQIKHKITGEVLFDSGKTEIRYADLQGANLRGANLRDADLQGANLRYANLRDADLQGANLRYADLRGANLRDADLRGANLRYAGLQGADLQGADLQISQIAHTRILPDGHLIGWKKCRGSVLVKLAIPEDARRSHAAGRKCRAEFADVLEIVGAETAISSHDGQTVYRVGERVTCDAWCGDWRVECAGGIHFFITREEAEAY